MNCFKNIILILLIVYLIFKPFYFWSSGLPQFADFILIIIVTSFIFKYGFKKNNLLLISALLIFYIFILNSIFALAYSNEGFILSSVYYLFNTLILLVVSNFGRIYGEKVFGYLFCGISLSVFVQLILSLFYSSGSSVRESLFFNNPNQLGYYTVLSFALIILTYKKVKSNILLPIIFFLMLLYLAMLSASQAAIFSLIAIMVLYLLIELIKSNVEKKIKMLLLVALGLVIFLSLEDSLLTSNNLESSFNRVLNVDLDIENNIEERRYDRIFEHSQYLVFGAGEGFFHERFGSGEIHSTLISFIFNYGIIGFIMLIAIFYIVIKKSNLYDLVPLVGIFMYGLTHNGIRQTFFWIVLGIIYFMKENHFRSLDGKL